MPYLALLCGSTVVALGLWAWFLRHVFKSFGWEGLALKSALVIDGSFLVFGVACHQLPGAIMPEHPEQLDDGSLYFALALMALWTYLLFADRPMRWLMKPPVSWVVYGMAALFYVAAFAAENGWL